MPPWSVKCLHRLFEKVLGNFQGLPGVVGRDNNARY